jgi:hypothetical protein
MLPLSLLVSWIRADNPKSSTAFYVAAMHADFFDGSFDFHGLRFMSAE